MLIVIFGNIALCLGLGLVPLSIHCIFSALPIVLGELFSGCILPHTNSMD